MWYGILSSHPAAVMAAARAFSEGIEREDLSGIAGLAREIMKKAPVEYVKSAELRGSLFEEERKIVQTDNAAQCCALTNFWVDHAEPEDVLKKLNDRGRIWPLGKLPDGCEWLVVGNIRKR
jgi:hypothetical protein